MRLFLSGLILILLCGCRNHSPSFFSIQEKNVVIDSDAIGFFGFYPLSTKAHNKRFELGFLVAPENVIEANKFIQVQVIYDGFPKVQVGEDIRLTLKGVSEDGKNFQINSKSPSPNRESIKQAEKMRKELKGLVANSRSFLITKKEFEQLISSREIKYIIKTGERDIYGEFASPALHMLQANGKVLLSQKPYKVQTVDEMVDQVKYDIKEAFSDFEVLKKGALKGDLEKYFKTKFFNTIKVASTGAVEEEVIVRLGGKEVGPLILGFDESNRLIYVRDPLCNSRISWLK